ncbi:tryptophan transporter [Peptoniphilus sp. oral taxon 386]|uniref:tryptophan transporter n=1 Tax=Peptoniphilus sp. oral taxon 386 TaxID=652713 RepID=UPI0001DA9D4E|nr:tryptophan transporter [Peptoniphilus sp. oral taxon 386]EFI42306.1 hypothetical protein HMPREF0629_00951 [Peptoniphilus sp. oral taxon 386 str. F0131]
MKTKNLTIAAVLLALGSILHMIVPGIINGMKPDFLLLMMFISILFNLEIRSVFTIGFVAGIIAAMTTTFPFGQIPSILDKLGSSLLVYVMFNLALKKYKINNIIMFIICFLGSIFSGFIFLYSALIISGLPEGATLSLLMVLVVFPTSLFTGVFGIIFYNIMNFTNKKHLMV